MFYREQSSNRSSAVMGARRNFRGGGGRAGPKKAPNMEKKSNKKAYGGKGLP